MTSPKNSQNELTTETTQELRDLRDEVEQEAKQAREKADTMDLDKAAASQHGMADAYESVIGRIDNRLYGKCHDNE